MRIMGAAEGAIMPTIITAHMAKTNANSIAVHGAFAGAMMLATLSLVFTAMADDSSVLPPDDKAQVARAVDYFKHGNGLGAVKNAIPVVYDDGLAEWLEAGRDQGHALLGVGLMGTFCEMAWNQGIDLYGYDDNRFLKGAQYVAKWSMGVQVIDTTPSPAGPLVRPVGTGEPAGRRHTAYSSGSRSRSSMKADYGSSPA